MRILVCVKQVPRLDQVRFDPSLNRIVREGVDSSLNPLDVQALGLAGELRSRAGGEVVAATMGPPAARAALEEALRAGADRAVHLCDARFAGADTLATARALARLCEREAPDLVLLGRSTIDGATAQVAPQLAEIAGLPLVTHVVTATVEGTVLAAVRECERGSERWRVSLPAVVSVERGPTPPPAGEAAGPVEELDADALGGDDAGYGIRGSATYVQRVEEIAVRRRGEVATGVEEVLERLEPRIGARPDADAPARPRPDRWSRELWVVVEQDGAGAHPASLEALACAARVADRLDAGVVAVLPCAVPGELPHRLAAHGADRVLVVRHPALAEHATEARTAALAELVAQRSPFAVIAGWTVPGRDYLPRVAARLALGLTGDFVGLDVEPRPWDEGTLDLVWLKPAWAGTALARVVARTTPSLGTLRPGAVRALPPRRSAPAPIETVRVGLPEVPSRAERVQCLAEAAAVPPPDSSPVLLCVGAAVPREAVDGARSLAAARGWGLGGTAAAVAAGLVPPQLEVSVLKRSLAPEVFIGVGLTGPEELDAVRAAGFVVTVIPDPGAGTSADARAALTAASDVTVVASPETFLAEAAAGSRQRDDRQRLPARDRSSARDGLPADRPQAGR